MGQLLHLLSTHWQSIVGYLALWSALATLANRRWPAPGADAPAWKRRLHLFLVDWPAALPSLDLKGTLGLPVSVPFLTVSQAVKALAEKKSEPEPRKDSGRASLWVVLVIGVAGMAAAALSAGCAPGADGLRQACAETKYALSAAYQGVGIWHSQEMADIRSRAYRGEDVEQLQSRFDKSAALYQQVSASLGAGAATAATACDSTNLVEASRAKDANKILAALAKIGLDAKMVYDQVTDLVKSFRAPAPSPKPQSGEGAAGTVNL